MQHNLGYKVNSYPASKIHILHYLRAYNIKHIMDWFICPENKVVIKIIPI